MSSGGRIATVAGLVVLVVVVAAAARTKEASKPSRAASVVTTAPVANARSATALPEGLAKVKRDAVVAYGDAPTVPVKTEVTSTRGLADGEQVAIHARADKGSAVYGFEAFQCTADAEYTTDADIRPTQTGKCFLEPVSASSDKYVAARSAPPYDAADAVFHVGVGTSAYDTQQGRHVAITCDADHQCVLVLKLQYPNGYGFQTIPLRFK